MMTGGCLCGALRYEVAAPAGELMHCHCAMCRKHHGAAFATHVAAPVAALRWLQGEASVLAYASSPGRVRRSCETCGSVAPSTFGNRVLLPAGNLVGELEHAGGLHMFTRLKAPWHVIADDLPRHDGAPPGWDADEAARPAAEAPQNGAVHGSCACGAVTFSVTGPPTRWLQCHCSRCRRGRSAAHGSNTFYSPSQFAWKTGQELVRIFRPADAERFTVSFCMRCGGGAPVQREGMPFVLVPAGLFDSSPGPRPEAHIHVASKAPWYPFHDELPQFAELPPP